MARLCQVTCKACNFAAVTAFDAGTRLSSAGVASSCEIGHRVHRPFGENLWVAETGRGLLTNGTQSPTIQNKTAFKVSLP